MDKDNNDFRPTMPAALVNELTDYPRIKKVVELEWATLRLMEYLNLLLADTRDHKRAGFPPNVSEALILLANKNQEALVKQGWTEPEADEFVSQFVPPKWKIPKNF